MRRDCSRGSQRRKRRQRGLVRRSPTPTANGSHSPWLAADLAERRVELKRRGWHRRRRRVRVRASISADELQRSSTDCSDDARVIWRKPLVRYPGGLRTLARPIVVQAGFGYLPNRSRGKEDPLGKVPSRWYPRRKSRRRPKPSVPPYSTRREAPLSFFRFQPGAFLTAHRSRCFHLQLQLLRSRFRASAMQRRLSR